MTPSGQKDSTWADGKRRTALVTGGRRGIGRGIAFELAHVGFNVVIGDLQRDDDAEETLVGIRERGTNGAFVELDVREVARHQAVLGGLSDEFGPIDCLVNNAGIAPKIRGDLLEMPTGSFDEVLATNLRGPFYLTQAMARQMLAETESTIGPRTIINISSMNASAASIEKGEYCISKAGMAMMSKLFALRLAAHGIGVFEVRPGIINTPMTSPPKVQDKHDRFINEGGVPAARWGQPEDVGKVVAALASGSFAFSTGEVVYVDGGLGIERL